MAQNLYLVRRKTRLFNYHVDLCFRENNRNLICSSIVKGLKSLFGVFELFIYSKSTIKELSFDPSLKFLRQLEVGEKKSMTSYFFRFP